MKVMQNRLETKLLEYKEKQKKLFCAYITLGYPNLKFTEELLMQLPKVGVDIVELGIPFSDPLADGPIIQSASYFSLKNGTKIQDAFKLMARLRRKGFDLPVVFFSYFNIINNIGIDSFARKIKKAGFDAVLCPDLPIDESMELEKALKLRDISNIYLIAPTTKLERMQKILKRSEGFIYYVSRKGVTGVQTSLAKNIAKQVNKIRHYTTKAVLVGFGVSNNEHVKIINSVSDGVIVGSAIIKEIEKTKSVKKVLNFIKKLKN